MRGADPLPESSPIVRFFTWWLERKIRGVLLSAAVAIAFFGTELIDTFDRLFGTEHLPELARSWVTGDPASVEIRSIAPKIGPKRLTADVQPRTIRFDLQVEPSRALRERLTVRCALIGDRSAVLGRGWASKHHVRSGDEVEFEDRSVTLYRELAANQVLEMSVEMTLSTTDNNAVHADFLVIDGIPIRYDCRVTHAR